jgi:hypothetical protein
MKRRSLFSPIRLRLASLVLAACALCSWVNTPIAAAQTTVRGTSYGTVVGTTPGTSRMNAGLEVSVKITQNLSSKTSAEGDEWDGVLAKDLIVGGHLLTPSGTQVTGVVSKAISANRNLGNGTLAVRLTSIHGIGVSSTPVVRQGINPALTSAGNMAAAGIPGEANAPAANTGATATPGANGPAMAEARFASGAILTFTTE